MLGAHPTGGNTLFVIWAAGLACCFVGIVFLHKAVTCERFRESDSGEGKKRASPIWEGRIISGCLGLMGMGMGVFIIVRILAGHH